MAMLLLLLVTMIFILEIVNFFFGALGSYPAWIIREGLLQRWHGHPPRAPDFENCND